MFSYHRPELEYGRMLKLGIKKLKEMISKLKKTDSLFISILLSNSLLFQFVPISTLLSIFGLRRP